MSALSSFLGWTLLCVASAVSLYLLFAIPFELAGPVVLLKVQDAALKKIWRPPTENPTDDLNAVIDGTGVFSFAFNDTEKTRVENGNSGFYAGWNWCNMPHVDAKTDLRPPNNYKLEYVEVIHRHHKRTLYAANLFPRGPNPWNCSSTSVFSFSISEAVDSASTFFSPYSTTLNPFSEPFESGTSCLFPQISSSGLRDSVQHGSDLRAVYQELLGFLPETIDLSIQSFRVTNNPITSHIASAVIAGMYPNTSPTHTDKPPPIPLLVQPSSIDSLEPTYRCPHATKLGRSYGVGSKNPKWTAHLQVSESTFKYLDDISHVPADDTEWHQSWDHYFDNLSSRLCHSLPLPCAPSQSQSSTTTTTGTTEECINMTMTNQVLRLGMHEYSYLYRRSPHSLEYSTARFGAWIAELSGNVRNRVAEIRGAHGRDDDVGGDVSSRHDERKGGGIRYRHNVAHDGSLAALLSILQIEVMAWPGMGAEVVFEVYRGDVQRGEDEGDGEKGVRHEDEGIHDDGEEDDYDGWYMRVLYGGVPLPSSHPALRPEEGASDEDKKMGMLPLKNVMAYFEELVGADGEKVVELCSR